MPGKVTKSKSKPASATSSPSRYAPTSWGQNANALEDLELPSGQLCLARRLGPTKMLEMGLLDKFDILGSIMQRNHIDRVDNPAKSTTETDAEIIAMAKSVMADPAKLIEMLGMIDNIVRAAVVEPKLSPEPNEAEGETYEVGKAYVSWIDEDDKMFIFQWCMGGSKDLERFRSGLTASMASLANVEGVPTDTSGDPVSS